MLLALMIIVCGGWFTIFMASSKSEFTQYLHSIKKEWTEEGPEDLDQILEMLNVSFSNKTVQFSRAGMVTTMTGILDLCIRKPFSLPATWLEGFVQLGYGCGTSLILLCVLSLIFTISNWEERNQLLGQIRSDIWNNPNLLRTYEYLVGRAPAINDLLRELHPLTYKHLR